MTGEDSARPAVRLSGSTLPRPPARPPGRLGLGELRGPRATRAMQQVQPLFVRVGADLEVPRPLCLFPLSDRNRGFEAEEDCGNRDSDVLHSGNHNSPGNRLLHPQLAGHPAGHHAAQLPLPPLLLVTWRSSSLNACLLHGSAHSTLPGQREHENHSGLVLASAEWQWALRIARELENS